jgi:uncharacterized protein
VRITLEELELDGIVVSKTYAPGMLDYHGAEFQQVAPLKVEAVAELAGSEIRVRGHLGTQLEAFCARCLSRVVIPVESDFDLFYRPLQTIARGEEIEVPTDELAVGFFADDGIELADVVTEQVILSVPMKVVCRAECQGLCPICGANRNVKPCRCVPPADKSPFASLKED